MKPRKKCKHCGHWLEDHKNPTQKPERLDEIFEDYPMSLFECLQGTGFEPTEEPPQTLPLSKTD